MSKVNRTMQDESIFTKNQSKEISEGLQNFIDSMVEEIVLEGKPFDAQKKYLKKFSENEGLDYDKLEADITTFIEILDSLKTAFNKLQVKLAEEKGRDCHITDETVKKLVKHSSQPHQKEQEKTLIDKKAGTGNGGSLNKTFLYGSIVLLLLVVILFFSWQSSHYNSENKNEGTSVEKKNDSPIIDTNKTMDSKVKEFQTREISMGEERENTTLDLSVEFPINGNDDLLFAIRDFINKTIVPKWE